jgi:excisionase family DNA binding protein
MRSANRIVGSARREPEGTTIKGLERRRHFRVAGAWPVRLRVGHEVIVEGTAADISLAGMLVKVPASVAVESGRLVEVELPGDQGWVAARVARVEEVADDEQHARWGLELGDMTPSIRAGWARHVFTEARRLGYEEETEAWVRQNRPASLICPTCGSLMGAVAPERLVTAAGLAEHLDVNVGQIYRMARRGTLPCYRVGRRLRFDLAEVRDVFRSAAGRR